MPSEQGFRGHDARELQKTFSADGLALDSEASQLIVSESRWLTELLFENTDFLLEKLDDQLLPSIHPTGDKNQEKRESMHRETVTRPIAKRLFLVEDAAWTSLSFPMSFGPFEFSDTTG